MKSSVIYYNNTNTITIRLGLCTDPIGQFKAISSELFANTRETSFKLFLETKEAAGGWARGECPNHMEQYR